MLPKDFKESNFTYGKPSDMTDEQCFGLRVFKGMDENGFPVIVSVWQPNKEDIEMIMKGEPIYLSITGLGMPPVSLYTENPFQNG